MNILVLGDVVSQCGCEKIRAAVPGFKRLKNIDLCIANGENSAKGNGITPQSADFLFSSGVDFITTGNHAFRRAEMYDYFDESDFVIRPYNYPSGAPGKGIGIIDMGRIQVGVLNLSGTMFMESLENPFYAADKALEELKDCRIRLVDFHAETTSEKLAMGYYLDGKVSAVFGTHTHVQTSDERILEKKTGYITDLGMCGPQESVLGVKKEIVIRKFRTNMPVHFETQEDLPCEINGCIFCIDEKSGNCIDIERVRFQ